MNNKHEKRFLLNTLIGLLFTTASSFAVIYICFNKQHQQDWVFWAVVTAIGFNAGFLFIGSGAVHKVKADLIRRQKQKTKSDKTGGE